MSAEQNWDLIITGKKRWLSLQLAQTWRYRDLLYMLVKREFVVLYKQTILGPLWFFLQPVLTASMYIVVFTRIARISTDGIPPLLFYLCGTIIWNYFQESFNSTSTTFVQNANLFGKVYFPRIIVPLSKVISGLLKFFVQFALFIGVYLFFVLRGYPLKMNFVVLLFPVFVFLMGLLGLGLGIFFTSLTTKYRDLVFLLQFGIQLVMFATPVIYPLSSVPEAYKGWLLLNPMTPLLEGFRYGLLGTGTFEIVHLAASACVTVCVFVLGLLVFNYTEKDFMDVV